MRLLAAGTAILALSAATPCLARVVETSPGGFSTSDSALVSATPDEVWIELTAPAGWWNPEHSFSGDGANFSLYPVAGGCFCEELPNSGGSAEHARVINAVPGALLRLRGSFGPLQPEALTGVLTVTLKPATEGTEIGWDYVVGGHARFDLAQVAPAVDRVMSEQLARLADRLGRRLPAAH